MTEKINKVELLAVRQGSYTNYVFKNLDESGYIMCTRLPNWKVPTINIGDIGFLKYHIVIAGDEYYDPVTANKVVYNYSNIYFINFIDEEEFITNTELIL